MQLHIFVGMLYLSNDRFEKGVEKVANDEITKQAFLKMLEGFELSELQQSALKLL